MRRALVIAAVLVLLVGATASATPSLIKGQQLNGSKCEEPGKLAINVTQDIINDIDSGVGGNYWAVDSLNRQIQVWKTGTDGSFDVFCALVKYQGSFVTVAGLSPAGLTTIFAGIEGTFDGGYRATVKGILIDPPTSDTRGNIGKFNYGCDPSTGICANYVSWLDKYFQTVDSFTYEWWGWIYRAGSNGKWVNSSEGNSGDIHN